LQFNGVEKMHFTTNAGGGYHKWVPTPLFAEVQLEAGVQVLKLICNREHVNADYIQFSLVTPTGLDEGDSGAGGAGSGGASGASGSGGALTAGSAGADSAGSGGSTASAGQSASGASAAGASGVAGAAASSAGAASTAGAGGAPSSAGAAGALTPGSNSPAEDSGCGCRIGAPVSSRAMGGWWLAAIANALVLARRKRRTHV